MFILVHRDDETFLAVDDLRVNLTDLLRLDAQDHIVSFRGGNLFAFLRFFDREGAGVVKLLL